MTVPNLTFAELRGFHGAFATGVASQQGALTLPDTWFRPPFWDLLMLQLLRPNSSNLPCLCSTFHLEYPLVLSRFYYLSIFMLMVTEQFWNDIIRICESRLEICWVVYDGTFTSSKSHRSRFSIPAGTNFCKGFVALCSDLSTGGGMIAIGVELDGKAKVDFGAIFSVRAFPIIIFSSSSTCWYIDKDCTDLCTVTDITWLALNSPHEDAGGLSRGYFLRIPSVSWVSLLVFNVTCTDISVIYVTAQMCRRIEEVVPTVGLPRQ